MTDLTDVNPVMADALRPFVGSGQASFFTGLIGPDALHTQLARENDALRERIAFLEAQWKAQWAEASK